MTGPPDQDSPGKTMKSVRSLSLALALFVSLPLIAQAGSQDDVLSMLRKAATDGVSTEAEAVSLAVRLASLGGTVVPDLLDAAAVGVPFENEEVNRLSPLARAAVVEALGHLPSQVVRAHLWLEAREPSSDAVRLSALDVLGTIGTGADVELLLALTRDPTGEELPPRKRRAALARAFERIAERDEELPQALRRALPKAHVALLADVVDALAAPNDRAARRELSACLGSRAEADPLLFARLAKLVDEHGRPDNPALERQALAGLVSSGPRARTHAAELAGALDLMSAVPDLIQATASRDQLERQAAARALQRILGFALPADGEAWPNWAKEEENWWKTRGSRFLAALDMDDPAMHAAAIRELAAARLHRDDVIPSIVPFVHRGDVAFRKLVVSALGSLGGRDAEDALLKLLEDPDPDEDVRLACLSSLRRCTGMDLGENPMVWSRIIEVRRR